MGLPPYVLIWALKLLRFCRKRLLERWNAKPPRVYYPAHPRLFRVSRYPRSSSATESRPLPSPKSQPSSHEDPAAARRLVLMDIRSFLRSRVPSLYEAFKPTWWLASGHLQTAYVVLGDSADVDQVLYERTLLRTPDGGTLGLDETPISSDAAYDDLPPDAPVIVVQHGLTGGSYEPYVRAVLVHACAPRESGGLGFRAIVVNFRACANVPITSAQFYSAGNTDDLRTALLYIKRKYPLAPLVGLGFSLGANILTRYLGEEGEESLLLGGLALACPWDIVANSDRLQNDTFTREIYSKSLGSNIQALFRSHEIAWKCLAKTDKILASRLDYILNTPQPTFRDMDRSLISIIGGGRPPFPFKDLYEYYRWASSHKSLSTISVPFLAINSQDDPIVAHLPTSETVETASACAIAVTHGGGHLGWWTGGRIGAGLWGKRIGDDADVKEKERQKMREAVKARRPRRWYVQPTLEFLRACAEDVDLPPAYTAMECEECEDGFVFDSRPPRKGHVGERIGYKVLQNGGEIIRATEAPGAQDMIRGL